MRYFITPLISFGLALATTITLYGKTNNSPIVLITFLVFIGATNAIINTLIDRFMYGFRKALTAKMREEGLAETDIPKACFKCGMIWDGEHCDHE